MGHDPYNSVWATPRGPFCTCTSHIPTLFFFFPLLLFTFFPLVFVSCNCKHMCCVSMGCCQADGPPLLFLSEFSTLACWKIYKHSENRPGQRLASAEGCAAAPMQVRQEDRTLLCTKTIWRHLPFPWLVFFHLQQRLTCVRPSRMLTPQSPLTLSV